MSALYYDSCGHKLYVFDPSLFTWQRSGATQLNDTAFVVGKDTITIHGTGGGGGGSGTVNNGTQYRIAYYAANGTAVSENAAITGNRALASNANGLPIASTVTTTELSNLSGTTSGIQAQLNAKSGPIVSDYKTLSQVKIYSAAQGVASSSNVTNYSHTAVDSVRYKFSTTLAGQIGAEFGGWLAASTSGDSIKVTAPFGVLTGDSQIEGHPGRHGRLHPLVSGTPQNIFKYDYPDSTGQLSYHLRQLTNYRWYNHGIGGQTTVQLRQRFLRDCFGVVSNPSDGRGTQTLNRLPNVVVIICGINDVFESTITPK
ncbi:hypothetical protein [Paraflavitalea speifideaquila]|uniref:hypothetical protein n=1 Tax=Paraflavitalea speifideaquila TaxID=3076558 RepID=UPI0028EAEAA8|nr:hypothetical protein [Paraflavitalea speifideiaquila]